MTSLDLTYEMIPASYAVLVQRLDALGGRIQSLMVFSGSFLLTGPALAAVASNGVSFASYWFYAAVGIAVLNVVIGLVVRSFTTLRLPRLHDIDSEWLELDVEEFKRSSLWWANKDLIHNAKILNATWSCALAMTALLIAELVSVIVWGMSQLR